jgi:3D (Asp-Asp-Asp) domain-containing protein
MKHLILTLTYYTLTPFQLQLGYGIAASGTYLHEKDGYCAGYCAVSQDLLWYNGGPVRYGDTIVVLDSRYKGKYVAVDTSAPFVKKNIDVFVPCDHKDPEGIRQVKVLIKPDILRN